MEQRIATGGSFLSVKVLVPTSTAVLPTVEVPVVVPVSDPSTTELAAVS